MSILSLKPNSMVYHGHVKSKILKAIDLDKVLLQNIEDGTTKVVEIKELRVTTPEIEKPAILYEDLSQDDRKIALERFEIIKPLLEPGRTRILVKESANKCGRNISTLYRWVDRYMKTRSIVSLAPNFNERGGKGVGRFSPEVEAIISHIIDTEYMTDQRKNPQEIYESVEDACKKAGLKPPVLNTIKNRINKLSQKAVAVAREGEKGGDRFNVIEDNFPRGTYPLECVQVDHARLNVIVVDEVYRKPIGRPWITLIIDIFSRMIYGFYISLDSPSFFSLAQALLQGILPKDAYLKAHDITSTWEIQGLPKIVHCDNAGEFNAEDFLYFCTEYKIEINWRPVKKPRYGGHVERLARTVKTKLKSLPGTTFSNVGEKGEYDSEGKACFTVAELEQWIATHILGVYHNNKHSSLNMSPRRKYNIGIFGDDDTPGCGLPDIVDDVSRLRLSLFPSFPRTIQRDGVVLDRIKYFHDCLRRWVNVKDENGENRTYVFRRDPRDISKLYFFDPEIQDHFAIPYRDFRRPPMTIWDLKASKKYLSEKGVDNPDEHQIFQAREKMRAIESAAADKTKSVRKAQEAGRRREKALKTEEEITNLPKSGASKEKQSPQDSGLADIFASVQPFAGIEVVKKNGDPEL